MSQPQEARCVQFSYRSLSLHVRSPPWCSLSDLQASASKRLCHRTSLNLRTCYTEPWLLIPSHFSCSDKLTLIRSLNSSSSTSSIGSLDTASSNGRKKPLNAFKRTQEWVNAQQINGAYIVGRDRRIASAHRSALYSILDEMTATFPCIGTDLAAEGFAGYDLELEIDDDDE
jgi:hypothetical protein